VSRPGLKHANVSWTLNKDGVARIDQDPGDEVERLLPAGRHEHVLRTDVETVMRSPVRNGLPQRG
jgi:hypothetical protein